MEFYQPKEQSQPRPCKVRLPKPARLGGRTVTDGAKPAAPLSQRFILARIYGAYGFGRLFCRKHESDAPELFGRLHIRQILPPPGYDSHRLYREERRYADDQSPEKIRQPEHTAGRHRLRQPHNRQPVLVCTGFRQLPESHHLYFRQLCACDGRGAPHDDARLWENRAIEKERGRQAAPRRGVWHIQRRSLQKSRGKTYDGQQRKSGIGRSGTVYLLSQRDFHGEAIYPFGYRVPRCGTGSADRDGNGLQPGSHGTNSSDENQRQPGNGRLLPCGQRL